MDIDFGTFNKAINDTHLVPTTMIWPPTVMWARCFSAGLPNTLMASMQPATKPSGTYRT